MDQYFSRQYLDKFRGVKVELKINGKVSYSKDNGVR